jgi:hypothetical protein
VTLLLPGVTPVASPTGIASVDQPNIRSAVAAGTVVQFQKGTYGASSSARNDAGVSYTGSGSNYTWTDTHITSGDVGSYVIGVGIEGRAPQILSVTPGTGFVTDAAPGGTITAASVYIVNPAFVLGDGVTVQGTGSSHGAGSAGGGTIIDDSGTGVTCLLRGGNNVSDYVSRSKIKDLSIWGATSGVLAPPSSACSSTTTPPT